jgi:A/G-specific adenine glycosylase
MRNITILNLFRETIWEQYRLNGRHDLPWRQPERTGSYDPYKILVSELMLQQTQVNRVIPKYLEFLKQFPTPESLASAALGDVLRAWSGLGYNRRAKYLKQAAEVIVTDFEGKLPGTQPDLIRLPGVGNNTAGAVMAYAYNAPVTFIETNIRTVYIHHFFSDQTDVPDRAITELVAESLDRENPREWYWALMDYGSQLKQSGIKLNPLSKGYTKQSIFEGSRRQVRGKVLKHLHDGPASLLQLQAEIADDRLETVLSDLVTEGMIKREGGKYHL